MRWWGLAAGGVLLVWVLATAHSQARRRGRRIGVSLLLSGAACVLFATAVLAPRPPVTATWSQALVVGSVVMLAAAVGVVLWQGFRR